MKVERRTINFLKEHARGGVSKAFWPESARRAVATHKAAQRRRILIIRLFQFLQKQRMRCVGFLSRSYGFYKYLAAVRVHITHLAVLMIASCIVQICCMLYNWSMVFVLGMLGLAIMLILLHLVSDAARERQSKILQQTLVIPQTESLSQSHAALFTAVPHTERIWLEEGQQRDPAALPANAVPFPATPMPTPLVRVLETIDLSSTNIEHFLDTRSSRSLHNQKVIPETAVPGTFYDIDQDEEHTSRHSSLNIQSNERN